MTWTRHENGAGATPTCGRRRRRLRTALYCTVFSHFMGLCDVLPFGEANTIYRPKRPVHDVIFTELDMD